MSHSSTFRYDISFLRAFSVLAVVFYHFKIPGFTGGFIGVDVFFVISGFLMTKIILTSFEKGQFNLLEFYGRRVTRIVPALFAMTLLVGLLIYIVLPVQFLSYIRSASSSLLFLSNIQYYLQDGYFSTDSQTNFLLHTWSLSVEWQFYILFPIVLWLFKKSYLNRKKLFVGIFLSLMLLSFCAMIWASFQDSSFAFYMFVTRACEMMAGGLVFLMPFHIKNMFVKKVLSSIAVVILSVCVYIFDEDKILWPSWWTLIPVFATVGLLGFNFQGIIYRSKVVQFLGNTSYSFYLWHWPIYVIALLFGWSTGFWWITGGILVSFVLAIISYYTVEHYGRYTHRNVAIITFVASFILLFSYFKVPNNLFIREETEALATTETLYNDGENMVDQYRYGTHHLSDEQNFKDYNLKLLEPQNDKMNVVLLGDSHAGMFAQSFVEAFPNWHIIQATADAAFPIPRSESRFSESVKFFNYFYDNYFPKNASKIDLVVISANYVAHNKDLLKYIDYITDYMDHYHMNYMFVGQTPTYAFNYPTVHFLKSNFNYFSEANTRKYRFNSGVNKILSEKLQFNYINILNSPVQEISDDGIPYLYDAGHLSYYGAQQYMPIIKKILSERVKMNSEGVK